MRLLYDWQRSSAGAMVEVMHTRQEPVFINKLLTKLQRCGRKFSHAV
jgi:hypothetical protein